MLLREIKGKLRDLKGVGPAAEEAFHNLGITSPADLLLHAPRDYEDRRNPAPIARALEGRPVNTLAEVIAHDYFGFGKRRTLKVWIEDESGRATLNCFGRNFLSGKLAVGTRIRIYGRFEYRYGELQASAFEFEQEVTPAQHSLFGIILPVYPANADLSQKLIRSCVRQLLDRYADRLDAELPVAAAVGDGAPKGELLRMLHFPDDLDSARRARTALAWEELLILQLGMTRRGLELRNGDRTRPASGRRLSSAVLEALPFKLTPDQETVLGEIRSDMQLPRPMGRLLQGDVGSGKTLIAFLAVCEAVERGEQAAFMAPTELLARQHADNAARILEPAGIKIALFSGAVGGEARELLLERLAAGEIDLLIGTHALFSSSVRFKRLGLAIIDEQQRFGVLQRNALQLKGEKPDLLVMTATPIPRTLAMTLFGDLEVSLIRTMPPGRKPVITHLAAIGKEEKVYDWLERELSAGRQAYCVYPLIAETGKLQLKDAEGMYRTLKNRFPRFRLGLIHSRLDEEEKLTTMRSFASGDIDILVATSVVEVGVDVSNATCMVIEHAERFGLSALHQLRGRVGRGEEQSYCFLVYDPELTEAGKQRLKVMKEEQDGFAVAEEDLKIRGPGNISGVEQAGFLRLRFADLVRDASLMIEARDRARSILAEDPGLLNPKNAVLRGLIRQDQE